METGSFCGSCQILQRGGFHTRASAIFRLSRSIFSDDAGMDSDSDDVVVPLRPHSGKRDEQGSEWMFGFPREYFMKLLLCGCLSFGPAGARDGSVKLLQAQKRCESMSRVEFGFVESLLSKVISVLADSAGHLREFTCRFRKL